MVTPEQVAILLVSLDKYIAVSKRAAVNADLEKVRSFYTEEVVKINTLRMLLDS